MSDYQLIPSSIIWDGPNGTKVFLNEDGVHLRFSNPGGIEEAELNQLIEIVQQAKRYRTSNQTSVPRPPTREEIGTKEVPF